ncbi:ABC transporter permease [Aquisphaera insulae]|uniref:ABC transporter permease n=1 Tax=Aquisphaera insulae TaxID=2712864 RepID=UPI0013EC3019|nr:ABC transporter permease [Aquisphaera insulae]
MAALTPSCAVVEALPMVDLATKILLDDKTRFLTTVSGVAFAVMLVIVQVGIFLGMLESASITIERLDADLWVTARNTPNIDFANTFPELYVHRVRSVPGVGRADNLIVWFVTVALPSGAKEAVIVYGLEDFRRWRFPWNVVSGDPADLRRGRYVFVDESAARRFGPFAVGDHREFLGLRLKIIGLTREARSFTTNPIAFLDYRVAQALAPLDLRRRTTYILVKLAPGADVEAVRAEIRRRLPYNDVRTGREWAARSRDYWVQNTGLGLSMYMTVFLGCLVGVVVVAQTSYTATIEHFKEFAIVKAIGGRNADIYRVIARQATTSAVVGFLVGVTLAHAIRPLLAALALRLVIPPMLIGDVLVGAIVLCLAASLISFRKIAGLDPAVVFRT